MAAVALVIVIMSTLEAHYAAGRPTDGSAPPLPPPIHIRVVP
jgi:hypothetical protein